jgi:transketolase
MAVSFGPRRATYLEVTAPPDGRGPLSAADLAHFEKLDLVYRSLCALLFNYVPTSGHPGGSISSGRFVEAILFDSAEYDLADPGRDDADIVSYAAGHKAMGLYALWALRDEIARVAGSAAGSGAPSAAGSGAPSGAADRLLPADSRHRLRLEDLLGFRRSPITGTPLFRAFGARALDGHPTPATPFVRLSTGASGVGMASSIGLALGARDYYGTDAPRVHIVEGEGGLTPGRVAEALAAAGTASLGNVLVHLDWNQASIDSEKVCRDGSVPGDYVQWDPRELFYLHDWNVISVADGFDFQQVVAAQRRALQIDNDQPSAIVYRTVKGWKYGVEGKASHGAGHKLCSEGFYEAVAELTEAGAAALPTCAPDDQRCLQFERGEAVREECFWAALEIVRGVIEKSDAIVDALAGRLRMARERLDARGRKPRADAPRVNDVYAAAAEGAARIPDELRLAAGSSATLRGELGRSLHYLNAASGGALLAAAADLLGSTSLSAAGDGFPGGFWNAETNPGSRLLATGGICEDAMVGILSGISAFGHGLGVGSSYGAFLAPLGHIAARLHAIGSQALRGASGEPYKPIVLVCGHAGLKTGEDGPTHADPQALQLLQQNFPLGTAISLTPWDPQELWTLTATAIVARPAVISAFVTRPSETVLDREALGLAPPEAAAAGLYVLRRPAGAPDITVVLQESAVTYAFVEEALPLLEQAGIDALVYYVASAELFDLLPAEERHALFPEERAREAFGITGFTLPTLHRWIHSQEGLEAALHPYRKGHYLGSGQGEAVLAEAGLDGESQFRAIKAYLDRRAR